MTRALHLTLSTPLNVELEADDVAAFRGEDESGGFGLLPGHADFLTVMQAAVLRWRRGGGPWRFAAITGGVLTLSEGRELRVTCREAILGDDLAALEETVAKARDAAAEARREAHAEEVRLHARAVREIMRRMRGGDGDAAMAEVFE